MFSIKKYKTEIDGKEMEVHSRSDVSMTVEVGTNGPQGGNHTHGGRVYLRMYDQGSALMDFMNIKVLKDDLFGTFHGFEVIAGGDVEIQAMCDALHFAASALQEQLDEIEKAKSNK